jgi:hypothetical protein
VIELISPAKRDCRLKALGMLDFVLSCGRIDGRSTNIVNGNQAVVRFLSIRIGRCANESVFVALLELHPYDWLELVHSKIRHRASGASPTMPPFAQ